MSGKAARKASQRVSDAFDRRDLTEAANALREYSTVATGAKLGSLQRWTRLAGQADASDASTLVIWLLCRVAAGESIEKQDVVTVLRRPPWEAKPPLQQEAVVARREEDDRFFWVIRREKAAERQPPNKHDLAIWASRPGAALLEEDGGCAVERRDHPNVPGAFVCLDVLSALECGSLLERAQSLGFARDEPLEYGEREASTPQARLSAFDCLADDSDEEEAAIAPPPPAVAEDPRAGERSRTVVWIVDGELNSAVFRRLERFLPQTLEDCRDAQGRSRGTGTLAGFNRRWRFYKYEAGGTYRPHVDGAWPGSALNADDSDYVYDAFGDRLSRLTCLIYLNEEFESGETAFYSAQPGLVAVDSVKPRMGSVLFFPHGEALGSLIHEGAAVKNGVKFVVRTEVLYKYNEQPDPASSTVAASSHMPLPNQNRDRKTKNKGAHRAATSAANNAAPNRGGQQRPKKRRN